MGSGSESDVGTDSFRGPVTHSTAGFATARAVHHPEHYGGADNPYEAIKVIQALGFTFELGNAFKYMARAGKKDGANPVEDLEKARWYLTEEIAQWRAGKRGAW